MYCKRTLPYGVTNAKVYVFTCGVFIIWRLSTAETGSPQLSCIAWIMHLLIMQKLIFRLEYNFTASNTHTHTQNWPYFTRQLHALSSQQQVAIWILALTSPVTLALNIYFTDLLLYLGFGNISSITLHSVDHTGARLPKYNTLRALEKWSRFLFV